ncbi:unnamed protein product, partial [Candidula unifasciata]
MYGLCTVLLSLQGCKHVWIVYCIIVIARHNDKCVWYVTTYLCGIYHNPYYGSDDEYRLVRDLMKSYNKQVRPSLFNNLALNVSYGVALAQIIDL